MRTRSLLSPNQRELAVDYFEQGYGAGATANRLRVPMDRVRMLYERWRIHGRLCLVEKPTKTAYSYDRKKEIVDRFLAGESKRALAEEFQLSSPNLVKNWVHKYRVEGEDGLRPKPKGRPKGDPDVPQRPVSELERVQRENVRLRAENAYLKKLRDLRDQGLH
ncbi:helix-turn-helix domain-containing protein [Actinomycetaceae bacterium MB13-C1-2]|nr:helix-turn-helix domain-containing protein [Actinomycetaceae bacterium MB13-C1-2]WRS31083.1 helix-turn-helix domain-containing protein [Actinomycetaceae bacterium MB13-C1-2]